MKLWKNSCIILPCTNYGCEQGWFSWSLSKIDVRGLVLSNGQTFGAFTTSKQKSNEDCMSCMGESTSEHWVGYFNCRGFAECKITKIQLKVSLPRLLQNSTCKSFCRCRGGGDYSHKTWVGCGYRLIKPVPSLRSKSAIFCTLFQYPISDQNS